VVTVHTYGEAIGSDLPLRVALPPQPFGPPVDLATDFAFWARSAVPAFHASPVVDTADTTPEEKEIKEVRVENDRFAVVWATPIVRNVWTGSTQARVFTAKMKVFGYDAPEKFPTATLDAETPPRPVWSTTPADYTLAEANLLPLDRSYKDITIGEELLVHEVDTTGKVLQTVTITVTGVAERDKALGPLPAGIADNRYRGKFTELKVALPSPPTPPPDFTITDRRYVTVYRLKGPAIPLWPRNYAATIDATRLYVPAVKLDKDGTAVEIGRTIVGRELKPGVAIRPTDIQTGREVLLMDHFGAPIAAEVTGCTVTPQPIDGQDFLLIDVSALSPVALDTQTAVLLGNVARATHGESVRDEALGDGDAATPFQRFALRKKPLTYVPSPESARGEAALSVLVNGEQWHEAASLYGQPPTSRVYTARQADDGTTVLQFGDGTTGSRLPSGRGNLAATYRQGSGLEGRLKAGQLNILLDRPVGLKDAANPAVTEGGADPEVLDRARQVAPTTVRTFGRAISLLDFEWLTLESGQVAKAKATWVWVGLEKAVHLTVAGQQGGIFSPEALATLYAGLTRQRDPNHPLLLADACRVPIVVAAKVRVAADFVRKAVLADARRALLAAFAFAAVGFAQPVHLSFVYQVLQDVTGVDSIDVDLLHFKGYTAWTPEQLALRGATADPVQPHLRLFAARAATTPADPVVAACFGPHPPDVYPAEQAYFQNPAEDVQLTATGGLD